MVDRCYLDFRRPHAQRTPGQAAVADALIAVLGPVALTRDPWNGNPRDFYERAVHLRGVPAGADAVRFDIELGRERCQSTSGPIDEDLSHIKVLLSGPAPALDALWQQLRDALAPQGYRDETLAGPMAALIDGLADEGDDTRAAELRRAVTTAQIERIAGLPPHWPIVLSFTRPDDLDAILASVPHPEQRTTLDLVGLRLSALPATLLTAPARFSQLEALGLGYNQLTTLPRELRALHPGLRFIDVTQNPLRALDRKEWTGVKLNGLR